MDPERRAQREADDTSLATVIVKQIQQRPPRKRVEQFGRLVATLIGRTRLRAGTRAAISLGIRALVKDQFREDRRYCRRLAARLSGCQTMSEDLFQQYLDEAIEEGN